MLKSGKSVPPFVPILAAYPVLFLAAANPGQVSLGTTAVIVAASLFAALVAYGLLRPAASSRLSAGIATTLLVVMFFIYGQVSGWIDSFVIALRLGDNETPNILDRAPQARFVIALAWGVLALAGALLIAKSKWAARPELGKALNFSAVALMLVAFVSPSAALLKGSFGGKVAERAAAPIAGRLGTALRPDVYFIVLDGYARQDVLAKYYGFDNQPFVDQLRTRGFTVSPASSANYNWTFLSLASTLNLGYLHDIFPRRLGGPDGRDRSVTYEGIRNSETARFLRERGYKIVHLRSTWGATSVNPYADREIRCEQGVYANEFVRAVAEASWLGAFHSKAGVDLAQCHLANFEALAGVAAVAGPKFVFAHFLPPHHPYLFDRDGNVLRNAIVSNQFEFQKRLWEDRQAYVSQLEFVNRKVIEAIDGILAKSAQPPIIVLESDHGPGLANGLSQVDHLAVRLANLGAYHLPGAPDGLIPPDGSAVNQFRSILSHYFGADLPLLPARHFVSPYGSPYAFREMPHEKLTKLWARMQKPDQSVHAEKLAAELSGEMKNAEVRR